jgi:uncharacterized protein YdcH (DUF465 family)
MLGEKHSLDNEFPEYHDTIAMLTKNDEVFAKENKHYIALDKKIRTLELNYAPIGDTAMQQLKLERAALKDELYEYLVKANN